MGASGTENPQRDPIQHQGIQGIPAVMARAHFLYENLAIRPYGCRVFVPLYLGFVLRCLRAKVALFGTFPFKGS